MFLEIWEKVLVIINLIIKTVHYMKNGKYISYYEMKRLYQESIYNEQICEECTYVNDMKQGECKTYNTNGNIQEIGNYIDNEPDGFIKAYYETGKIWYKDRFIKGIRQGISTIYHDNGKIQTRTKYKDDKEVGLIEYTREEKLKMNVIGYKIFN
jgi:antitoxin component YwqK of YwqJK toxin-antitoxin module